MTIFPTGKYKNIRLSLCIVSFLSVAFISFLPNLIYFKYNPQEGDIVFQSLPDSSDLVKAIEGVSGSKYSHCGVVIKLNGKWYVKEALGDVHDTELLNWITRGRGYRIDVYRFSAQYTNIIKKFLSALNNYQNLAYDFQYKLDDLKVYCSELPFRAFKDITGENLGRLTKLGDMNWKPYEKTIIEHEEGPVPLERLMITPKNLSEASQLKHVQSLGL
jgi:hypothetical protein